MEQYTLVRSTGPADDGEERGLLFLSRDIDAVFLAAKREAIREFAKQVRLSDHPGAVEIGATEFGYDILEGPRPLVRLIIAAI